jgi:hypothetical protein
MINSTSGDGGEVLRRAERADGSWLAVGVGLELLWWLGYVATVRLVLRIVPVREVRQLAWAEMAFEAVVPAGEAGGLAVGAWAMQAGASRGRGPVRRRLASSSNARLRCGFRRLGETVGFAVLRNAVAHAAGSPT